jgi:hypothetical protein
MFYQDRWLSQQTVTVRGNLVASEGVSAMLQPSDQMNRCDDDRDGPDEPRSSAPMNRGARLPRVEYSTLTPRLIYFAFMISYHTIWFLIYYARDALSLFHVRFALSNRREGAIIGRATVGVTGTNSKILGVCGHLCIKNREDSQGPASLLVCALRSHEELPNIHARCHDVRRMARTADQSGVRLWLGLRSSWYGEGSVAGLPEQINPNLLQESGRLVVRLHATWLHVPVYNIAQQADLSGKIFSLYLIISYP